MHKNIILIAETGSDITPEVAAQLGVYLVPMHVQMDDKTFDDGSFPPEDVCAYYDKTGKVPKTSGCAPFDFTRAIEEISELHPDKQMLFLAYSAVTTVSFQSAQIASEGTDFFYSVDTKHVSHGQGVVVREVARYMEENPESTVEEVIRYTEMIREKVQMSFMPNNLDYLRAGGRVSNGAAILGNILGLHPCIEIEDGRLMAKKKYRGSMNRVAPKMLKDFFAKYNLKKEHIYLIWAPGFSDESKKIVEDTIKEQGYTNYSWHKTGCVITCHGGYGAFGIVGVEE